ncbi:MAG: PTS glucitol/sorbitol transporter subunit IIA [Olsenella sp.]|nr:PTS glucitol/sorbitol transporter subunit IIA [Olsenella sp.]MCI1793701.1 PTS glucitol/sorbitol transporter subunit IIA [Olsenella sp.]MCI1811993.1 PTS glucitol/sorbitol transporter subunit IIA [Olsenella sp.]MCI1879123.1 PTS glucitol/sorbitol transporter subunit IIA [Olsenella sp.]
MIVLFGPTAPTELRDICVVHDGKPTTDEVVHNGGTISFNNQTYTIVEVGDVANENFVTLGHLTVNFSKEPGVLPGSIRVDTEEVPDINVGDTIAIQ